MLNAAVLNRPVDRLEHVARLARALAVEHPQVDEVRARRHPLEAPRRAARAGDDAGDVRAVTVEVATKPNRGGEVDVRRDVAAEVAVLGHPRIDHRHADAAAGVAADAVEPGPHLLCRRRLGGHRHRRIDRPILGHRRHRGVARERRQRRAIHRRHRARPQRLRHPQPVPRGQRPHFIGRPAQNHLRRLAALQRAPTRSDATRALRPRPAGCATALPTIAHSTQTSSMRTTQARVRPSFQASGNARQTTGGVISESHKLFPKEPCGGVLGEATRDAATKSRTCARLQKLQCRPDFTWAFSASACGKRSQRPSRSAHTEVRL